MKIPTYLIADNSALADDIFVIHMDYPRFIVNMNTDEIEWIDTINEQEAKENADEIEKAITGAYEFFDNEMENYND